MVDLDEGPMCPGWSTTCQNQRMIWHRVHVNFYTGHQLPEPRDEWYCSRCGRHIDIGAEVSSVRGGSGPRVSAS